MDEKDVAAIERVIRLIVLAVGEQLDGKRFAEDMKGLAEEEKELIGDNLLSHRLLNAAVQAAEAFPELGSVRRPIPRG